MNGSLIDDLLGQLQGAPAGQIAQQLGTDPRTAQDAIAAALPMIVGALGGLGGLLGSVLGGGAPASRQLDAGGILGHIFGGAQPRAESGLGQATGLNSGQSGQLLKILAPIVMAFLAKQVMAKNMDAGGLGSMLGQEHSRVQSQGGLGGGLMNAVLDQDGDGKVDLGDLLKIGGSLLGGRR